MNKQIITYLTIISIFAASCESSTEKASASLIQSIGTELLQVEFAVGNDTTLVISNKPAISAHTTAYYLKGATTMVELDYLVVGDSTTIYLPGTITHTAGKYTIERLSGIEMSGIADLNIAPLQSTGLIHTFIDAKSIQKDAGQKSTITTFPVDKFFNPSVKDNNVDYNISDGSEVITMRTQQKGTFSTLDIKSGETDKLLIGSFTKYGNSKEQSIRVLTGCPKKITIRTESLFAVADGRQFFRVVTEPIIDSYGHTVENGSMIYFRLFDKAKNEVAEYKAITVNGIASVWVRNPIYAGKYTIAADMCGTKSNFISKDFQSMIEHIDYTWESSSSMIKIGPVSSILGQYIPNGTPLSITFETEDGDQELSVGFKDGFATIDLSRLWGQIPDEALVEIYNRPFNIKKS